jgi:predicted DNA-binding protein (MmcQ/YjbR family)
MFDDDDPYLEQVRRAALGMPGANEKISHGRPTFFTTKVFAYYGGAQKLGGVWVRHDRALLVLPERAEREALLADARVWVPGYLGPYGWIGLDLDDDPDWAELRELLEESFRLTAPARLVAGLGSGHA